MHDTARHSASGKCIVGILIAPHRPRGDLVLGYWHANGVCAAAVCMHEGVGAPIAKWMSMKTNSSSASSRQLMSFEMQKSSNYISADTLSAG